MRKCHSLKTWPDSFEAMAAGAKTHEVRPSDRAFEIGDVLHLQEFTPCSQCKGTRREWDNGDTTECSLCTSGGSYTGRELWMAVTHVTPAGIYGVAPGFCVMSVRHHDAGEQRATSR